MNKGLWVAQGLLAVAFIGAGMMKLTTPIDELAAQMKWVLDTPEAMVRFIGAAEVLGAIGLILPAATRILPFLTPVAASALFVVMALAAQTHVSLGEWNALAAPFILGALSALVAWGRFKASPIERR